MGAVVSVVAMAGDTSLAEGDWKAVAQSNPLPVTIVAPPTTIRSSNRAAAAGTNANQIRPGTQRLIGGQIYNKSAAAKFVKFYAGVAIPTAGSGTPVLIITVLPNSVVSIADIVGPSGMMFAGGLGYTITGGWGFTDTTAVAVDDILMTVVYG